jgi:hypothetical protein
LIQKKWLYLGIGGGALVLIIILVLIVGRSGPDISGKYELLIAGKLVSTVIEIKPNGNNYIVTLSKEDTVRSEYILTKPRDNKFVIEKTLDGKPGDRFNLSVVDKGLEGTADILTLSDGVDVFFRKVK